MAVNVAEKLGVNKFQTDEHNSHIDVDKEYADRDEVDRVVRLCPAATYSLNEEHTLFFEHLGCLECGACKALSEGKLVKSWNYPVGTRGIEYRLG